MIRRAIADMETATSMVESDLTSTSEGQEGRESGSSVVVVEAVGGSSRDKSGVAMETEEGTVVVGSEAVKEES